MWEGHLPLWRVYRFRNSGETFQILEHLDAVDHARRGGRRHGHVSMTAELWVDRHPAWQQRLRAAKAYRITPHPDACPVDATPLAAFARFIRHQPVSFPAEWCVPYVLIRQGRRGAAGPQRLIRALGREAGNLIMAFHWPSFCTSTERAPHHTTHRNSLRAEVLRLNSVAGFAEPTLHLLGHTPTHSPNPSKRGRALNSFRGNNERTS